MLEFQPLGTYNCKVDRRTGTADQLVAPGVVISSDSDAKIVLTGVGNRRLPRGPVLTVVSNPDSAAISGTSPTFQTAGDSVPAAITSKPTTKGAMGTTLRRRLCGKMAGVRSAQREDGAGTAGTGPRLKTFCQFASLSHWRVPNAPESAKSPGAARADVAASLCDARRGISDSGLGSLSCSVRCPQRIFLRTQERPRAPARDAR